MENWYLASHKPGRHNAYKAQMFLSQQPINIVTFIPHICNIVPRMDRPGKSRRVIEPLFPGYIFLYFDPETTSISKINNCPGMNCIIRFSNVITPIHEVFVKEIMRLPVCFHEPKPKDNIPATVSNTLLTDEQHRYLRRAAEITDGQERSALLYKLTERHFLKDVQKNR